MASELPAELPFNPASAPKLIPSIGAASGSKLEPDDFERLSFELSCADQPGVSAESSPSLASAAAPHNLLGRTPGCHLLGSASASATHSPEWEWSRGGAMGAATAAGTREPGAVSEVSIAGSLRSLAARASAGAVHVAASLSIVSRSTPMEIEVPRRGCARGAGPSGGTSTLPDSPLNSVGSLYLPCTFPVPSLNSVGSPLGLISPLGIGSMLGSPNGWSAGARPRLRIASRRV